MFQVVEIQVMKVILYLNVLIIDRLPIDLP